MGNSQCLGCHVHCDQTCCHSANVCMETPNDTSNLTVQAVWDFPSHVSPSLDYIEDLYQEKWSYLALIMEAGKGSSQGFTGIGLPCTGPSACSQHGSYHSASSSLQQLLEAAFELCQQLLDQRGPIGSG